MNKSKQLREVIEVSMKMRQVKLAENIEVLTGDNYSEVIDSILESDIVKELLSTVSPQDEWVETTEGNPDESGFYWVEIEGGGIMPLGYREKTLEWYSGDKTVLRWCEMIHPKPPVSQEQK